MTYDTMPEKNIVLVLMWRSAAKRRYLAALAKGVSPAQREVSCELERYNGLSVQVRELQAGYGYTDIDPAVEQQAAELQLAVEKLLERLADDSPVGVELLISACRSRWNNHRSIHDIFGVEPSR